MKKFLFSALFLSMATLSSAQTATPNDKLGWDQIAPVLSTAQSYVYKSYSDATQAVATLSPVTCVGTVSPFQCTVPFPAYNPGSHSVQVTASDVSGESLKSTAFSFIMVLVPAAPQNLGKR